jgi:hypothetical protein
MQVKEKIQRGFDTLLDWARMNAHEVKEFSDWTNVMPLISLLA